jgi:hypothetical protein
MYDDCLSNPCRAAPGRIRPGPNAKETALLSVADRFCEAIKELTAERQTRSYAAQWIMVHSVARHLGISDEEAQEAIEAAGHRLKRAGDPPHSVSLIYGWGEE